MKCVGAQDDSLGVFFRKRQGRQATPSRGPPRSEVDSTKRHEREVVVSFESGTGVPPVNGHGQEKV